MTPGHEGDTSAGGARTSRGGSPYRSPVQPFDPPQWQEDAICRQVDPERWFPEKGGNLKAVKLICASCPVQYDCLEFALDHDERFGVWGGLSPEERRKLRRRTRKTVDITARRARVKQLAHLSGDEVARELNMTQRQVWRDREHLREQAS